MPAAQPPGDAFKALTDAEIERRAADDPDAGTISAGFRKHAEIADPDSSVTLQLAPDVVRWFRSQGTGYRARMNAALKSDVEAQKTTG